VRKEGKVYGKRGRLATFLSWAFKDKKENKKFTPATS
jgi:hypothetical protein